MERIKLIARHKLESHKPSGVYTIKNDTNGKYYVARAIDLLKAIERHKLLLESGVHPIASLQEDYNSGHMFTAAIVYTEDQGTDSRRLEMAELDTRCRTASDECGYNLDEEKQNNGRWVMYC